MSLLSVLEDEPKNSELIGMLREGSSINLDSILKAMGLGYNIDSY